MLFLALILKFFAFCSKSTRTWTFSSSRTDTGWTRSLMTKTWIWSRLKQLTPPACAARLLLPQPAKSSSTICFSCQWLLGPVAGTARLQGGKTISSNRGNTEMRQGYMRARRRKTQTVKSWRKESLCPCTVPPMVGSVRLTSALLVQWWLDWWQKLYL